MSTDYMARLKALIAEKHLPEEPSKPSKGGVEPPKGAFEGFEGASGRRFSAIRAFRRAI